MSAYKAAVENYNEKVSELIARNDKIETIVATFCILSAIYAISTYVSVIGSAIVRVAS